MNKPIIYTDADDIILAKFYSYDGTVFNGIWEGYYNTSILQCRGEILNDKRNGKWIWYNEVGDISAIGSYNDNKKVGLWDYNSYKAFYIN